MPHQKLAPRFTTHTTQMKGGTVMKKILTLICLMLSLCLLCACNGDTTPPEGNNEHTHTFGEWSQTKPATCTEKGSRTRTCACGESESEETDFAHKWGDWTVTTTAKCNATGEKSRTCLSCGEASTTTVPATGAHAYNVNNVCADCNHALQYTATGINYGDNGDGTCYVSSVDTNIDENVVIPYYHDGKKVTRIGASAFQNIAAMKSVAIPNTVISIGDSAFRSCSGLSTISIPAGVTSIDYNTFYGCSNLTSINIPASVTSIGSSAFSGCSDLTTINIPASVTSIGSSAFSGCNKLIEKEGGVSYVQKWVVDCDSSITSVTLRKNAVGIVGGAFAHCSSLTTVNIPPSVMSIDGNTFYYCSNLATVTFGENSQLQSIGSMAFYHCSKLASINIPANVTSIGSDAFRECSTLTTVTFGENSQLQSISPAAFYACPDLTTVTCDATGWWVSTDFTATSGTAAELNAHNLRSGYSYYHYWKRG